MARPLIPFVQNGYYASRNWIPLVKGNGFTTSGGGEQEEVWETASGSIVTFDAVAAPLRQLSVAVEPVQNLNGYDNPWPAGGGKNLGQFFAEYDRGSSYAPSTPRTYNDGILSISGTVDAQNVMFYKQDITSIMSVLGTATISLHIISGSVTNLNFRINVEETGQATERYSFETAAVTLTYNSAKTYNFVGFIAYIATVGGSVSLTAGVQIESGSTATSWEPYSNICPISGWTGAKIKRTGNTDNLLQFDDFSRTNDVTVTAKNGAIIVNGTTASLKTFSIPLKNTVNMHPDGHFVAFNNLIASIGINVCFRRGTTNIHNWSLYTTDRIGEGWTATANEDIDTLAIQVNKGTYDKYIFQPMLLEKGKQPFNTYTIQLGQTVYSGTLDVVNGKMTVDKAYVKYNGTEYWRRASAEQKSFYVQINTLIKSDNYKNRIICNRLKNVETQGQVNNTLFSISGYYDVNNKYPGENWIYCKADGNTIATVDDFKAWLASNNLQVVYELATPFELTLTPEQIATLQGTNNVWSDAGDVTVEYRAR